MLRRKRTVEVVCNECTNYSLFLMESGKDVPGFLGTCLPFRLKSGGITATCNAPLREKGAFAAWLDAGEKYDPEGMTLARYRELADKHSDHDW